MFICILICDIILTGCVVYDCFAVRKMFREYRDLLHKNQAQNNYITEREQDIDKLIKENKMLKELYNQVVEDNGKSDKPLTEVYVDTDTVEPIKEVKQKRRPYAKYDKDILKKLINSLKKDDDLTLYQAFENYGLPVYNPSRVLHVHGLFGEWEKIKKERDIRKIEKVNELLGSKYEGYLTLNQACKVAGISPYYYKKIKENK